MSLSNMNGGGFSCFTSNPIQLTLTQTNATFSGTWTGGQTTCTGPSGTIVNGLIPGKVVNGRLSGSGVSFDLDNSALHHVGTIRGTSMSGTASWTFARPVITLSGTWSAVKQ
jgi:hypothetical protein